MDYNKDNEKTYKSEKINEDTGMGNWIRLMAVLGVIIAFVIGWIYVSVSDIMDSSVAVVDNEPLKKISVPTAAPTVSPTKNPVPAKKKKGTESIYTYLQGPKSWSEKRKWSGYWGKTQIDGKSFGAYGCGLCCLANIYSSVTPYRCTPVQMYQYAKSVTDYKGGGAIAWGYMRNTLGNLGLSTDIKRKPQKYETFRKEIKSSICSIVLVSSKDSSCYWKNTPGHYVTIFLYDAKKDMVFLGDSGVPEHNRKWVSLTKIYNSLKKSSEWQYINVKSFDDNKCQWKNKNIKGKWIKPDYID